MARVYCNWFLTYFFNIILIDIPPLENLGKAMDICLIKLYISKHLHIILERYGLLRGPWTPGLGSWRVQWLLKGKVHELGAEKDSKYFAETF